MNKKKILILILIIIAIILLIIGVGKLIYNSGLKKEKNASVEGTTHGVVLNENLILYKKPGKKFFFGEVPIMQGDRAFIYETVEKDGSSWYKVKCNDRIGYILKSDVGTYEFNKTAENTLMIDVSKFDVISERFLSEGGFERFIVNNNINYVYIRAGGRGYGDEGNMYYDPNYEMFINACEYLKVPYGFYYLDEALNEEEVKEEVEFMKDFINKNGKEYNLLPVAIDIEYKDGKGRCDSEEELARRSEIATMLTNEFKNENIETIIYSNALYAARYLSDVETVFWLANYPGDNKIPEGWFDLSKYVAEDGEEGKEIEGSNETTVDIEKIEEVFNKTFMWQFTHNGAKEDGITFKVDLSLVKDNYLMKYMTK